MKASKAPEDKRNYEDCKPLYDVLKQGMGSSFHGWDINQFESFMSLVRDKHIKVSKELLKFAKDVMEQEGLFWILKRAYPKPFAVGDFRNAMMCVENSFLTPSTKTEKELVKALKQ